MTAASCHEGHEEVEICACAAAEDVHPFAIDCTDTAAIAAAETTLKTSDCQAVTAGTILRHQQRERRHAHRSYGCRELPSP